ncbi:MAG: endonuclease NucS, partial [Acidobacteriia bacterium]|nr:endonuclease NucS [Terriglobia bacterium]
QLQGYLENLRKKVNRPLRGIVVAPELRKSAQPLLESLKLEFVACRFRWFRQQFRRCRRPS